MIDPVKAGRLDPLDPLALLVMATLSVVPDETHIASNGGVAALGDEMHIKTDTVGDLIVGVLDAEIEIAAEEIEIAAEVIDMGGDEYCSQARPKIYQMYPSLCPWCSVENLDRAPLAGLRVDRSQSGISTSARILAFHLRWTKNNNMRPGY